MDEVGGGASELVSQALYGQSKSSDQPGEVLYELKEKKRWCCTYDEEVAYLFQDYVVIRVASQWCCCPMRYHEITIPKYKLCGATIKRGVNWSTISIAFLMLTAGFIFLIVGAATGKTEGDGGGGTVLIVFGAILLPIALVMFLLPMCLAKYYTELQVAANPSDPGAPFCGYESYFLRTFSKPDDDFIMLYIYGSLHLNMPGCDASALRVAVGRHVL